MHSAIISIIPAVSPGRIAVNQTFKSNNEIYYPLPKHRLLRWFRCGPYRARRTDAFTLTDIDPSFGTNADGNAAERANAHSDSIGHPGR
jgi:hypothetical protein